MEERLVIFYLIMLLKLMKKTRKNLCKTGNAFLFPGYRRSIRFCLTRIIFRLTEEKEQGTYILKPKPHGLRKTSMAPANEHLTMQIANQVYKINTAENGLVFFSNGEPAYITKRFDIGDSGIKLAKEDFASLARKNRRKCRT
jgi:serine/threonine-protein kinase HipA